LKTGRRKNKALDGIPKGPIEEEKARDRFRRNPSMSNWIDMGTTETVF